MNALELLDVISTGETSKVQFKREIDSNDSITAEMIAFSNSRGGKMFFGVEDKTGKITGLSTKQIHDYNQLLANIANDMVKPQIFIYTEVISVSSSEDDKKVLIVEISEGIAKPYKDKNGAIWVKQGSDKRRLTDNNEQIRLFQQSGILYLDEMIIPHTIISDVDASKVEKYVKAVQKRELDESIGITENLLNNLNIIKEGHITLGGLLFFANNPQKYRPTFCVKAISFFGNSIGGKE
jgi:predicted HTH transcriptional regulator